MCCRCGGISRTGSKDLAYNQNLLEIRNSLISNQNKGNGLVDFLEFVIKKVRSGVGCLGVWRGGVPTLLDV